MTDPITNPTPVEPVEPDEPVEYVPEVGKVVRLDDPAADGEPRYALYVAESTVLPLENVQRYELALYPAES